MKKRKVVVTGMGAVTCFGTDIKEFYQKLLAGVSGVRLIQGFDASGQPTTFGAEVADFSLEGYLEKKQARRVDPCIRYAIVAAKNALRDAGISPGEYSERTGVIIGSGMGGMQSFYEGSLQVERHSYRRLTPFFVPSILTNMAGAMLAIDYGFTGINYSISTACATANYSLLAAMQAIQNGSADVMVAGGAEAGINPICMAGFLSMKALSRRNDSPQKASRPWDKDRDGFVMGEGAGILVLEEEESAKKRNATIYAECKGGFTNCDAYHITDPRPDGIGMKKCMEKAIENAGLSPEDIQYINAHATSTLIGDRCEIRGIEQVFGKNTKNLLINSTKSIIGHSLGAAGGIEAIVTVMAILQGKVHPTLNLEELDPEIEGFSFCANESKALPIKAALSNSFGFGGHNSSIVFSQYDS